MQRPSTIRIGTRGSRLALTQAQLVCQHLLAAFPQLTVELVPIQTSGDRNAHRSLAEIGGKALFTKEIEEALFARTIDIAVHSLKDMETRLPEGLSIGAVLAREDPRDVLISPDAKTLAALPDNARIGTSSVRRAAQLRHLRPNAVILPFRGNVPTRLEKVKNGDVDATLLALAGLKRLGLAQMATEILDIVHFLPAAGQGVIAVECRMADEEMKRILAALNDAPTYTAILAERSLLAGLGGSCRTPIGGYARIEGSRLRLDAMIAKPDGTEQLTTTRSGSLDEADSMGRDAARELLANGGGAWIEP